MIELKNKNLMVVINPKGAELTHVVDNATGFDYIWNGAAWPKHAPILFPAIGRSTADSYMLNGRIYPMQQHGFASDYKFENVDQTAESVTLRFTDNDRTRQSYPFHFELLVYFRLIGNKLEIEFTVHNLSDETLSFALGFHPAFNLPGKFEEVRLQLTTAAEILNKFEIVKNPFPFRSGKLKAVEIKDIFLNRQLFAEGLVILDNKISAAVLSSKNFKLSVELSDFPYFCLWTKEDSELQYLCIEPFQGLPDVIDQKQELLEKEGNVRLVTNEKKRYQVMMTFG